MVHVRLPLAELIKSINDTTDPMDEWGQWAISYHILYLVEGNQTNLNSLLESVMTAQQAKDILEKHASEFKQIELTIMNYRDVLVDFEVDDLGLKIIRRIP